MAETVTGRKIVFFLGAGASRGAGAVASGQGGREIPIPIQSDFWDVFLRFAVGKIHRKTIERFLFRYFVGYAKVPSRLPAAGRRALLSGVDVEEVFTFLSERIRAPSTSAQLRAYVETVWAALVAEIGNVFSRFDPNSSTRAIYREMVRNHVRSRDAVVSFNYDDVFERSLAGPRRWAYEGLEDCRKHLRIIKPHGSVGWKEVAQTVQLGGRDDAVVVAPS
jgi:hypothetical protein